MMKKGKRTYRQETKEASHPTPIPEPSRIGFWDNIFYWLWHYTARNGYPFRAYGIVAIIHFIYCLLAIAIVINCLDAEAAWTLYLHEKGEGIGVWEPARRKGTGLFSGRFSP